MMCMQAGSLPGSCVELPSGRTSPAACGGVTSIDRIFQNTGRCFKRAKAVSLHTQQALREVIIQIGNPRPWNKCFAHGLSLPEALFRWHHDPATAGWLWRVIKLSRIGSIKFCTAPFLLMVGESPVSHQRQKRFSL